MGLTLAYTSALHALRLLRSEHVDVRSLDCVPIARPHPLRGRRWSVREFSSDVWRWQGLSTRNPLHVLVPSPQDRMWMQGVSCHVCTRDLPAGSVLWLDERASMVSPPMLFLQMASILSFPALVMQGHELCGHYTRCPDDPLDGPIVDNLPPATSVAELSSFLRSMDNAPYVCDARRALDYVQDHAASPMEALLSTLYALPVEELGYGMGPVTLNRRVRLGDGSDSRSRYPDLLFPFAPVGINYDGEDHLDLDGLLGYARACMREGDEADACARSRLLEKRDAVRAKVVDDTARNRQLATRGMLVFPATKENIYERGALDQFTRDILHSARALFGTDVSEYEKALDDTSLCNERYELVVSMLPFCHAKKGRHELL